jgi:hypothetical protein
LRHPYAWPTTAADIAAERCPQPERVTGALDTALGPAILGVIVVDRTNGAASYSSALHTALVVNGILLAVAAAAALACLLSPRAKA